MQPRRRARRDSRRAIGSIAASLLWLLAGCGGSAPSGEQPSSTVVPTQVAAPSRATAEPTLAVPASTAPGTTAASARGGATILDGCPSNDVAATPLSIPVPDGTPLEGALVGTGTVGVVLSNQNDNDVCPWLPFARALRDDGYQVLLYRYGAAGARPSADLAAAASALAAQGAERAVLVGASMGASATVVVASQQPKGVVAAVALSGVSVIEGRSITRYADQLSLPTLFVTADHDGSGSSQAMPLMHQRAPSKDKQLLVVPGRAHGWELLDDASVLKQVRAFIARYR